MRNNQSWINIEKPKKYFSWHNPGTLRTLIINWIWIALSLKIAAHRYSANCQTEFNILNVIVLGNLFINTMCVHAHADPLGCRHIREKVSLCKYELLCISMHTSLSGGTNRSKRSPLWSLLTHSCSSCCFPLHCPFHIVVLISHSLFISPLFYLPHIIMCAISIHVSMVECMDLMV